MNEERSMRSIMAILWLILPVFVSGTLTMTPAPHVFYSEVLRPEGDQENGIRITLACEKELAVGEEADAWITISAIDDHGLLSRINDLSFDLVVSSGSFTISDPSFHCRNEVSPEQPYTRMTDLPVGQASAQRLGLLVFGTALSVFLAIHFPVAGLAVGLGALMLQMGVNAPDTLTEWETLWNMTYHSDSFNFTIPDFATPSGDHAEYRFDFRLKRVREDASMGIMINEIVYGWTTYAPVVIHRYTIAGRYLSVMERHDYLSPATGEYELDYAHRAADSDQLNLTASSIMRDDRNYLILELDPGVSRVFKELSFGIAADKHCFLPQYPTAEDEGGQPISFRTLLNSNMLMLGRFGIYELMSYATGIPSFGSIDSGQVEAYEDALNHSSFTDLQIRNWESQQQDYYDFPSLNPDFTPKLTIRIPYLATKDQKLYLHLSGISVNQGSRGGERKLYNVFELELLEKQAHKALHGLVYIPGGTFTMGRTSGDGGSDELPTHSVTLNSFYIGKYEVTQAEYSQYMQPGSSWTSGNGLGGNYPAYFVSWYEILKYCNLRSMAEGLTPVYTISGSTNPANWGAIPTSNNATWNAAICNWSANGYRLPTEAEWEYAARGATNTPDCLYSGSDDINAVAWYSGNNTPNRSKPVGSKAPNGLGIYDMSGNLWEWCWDWHGNYSSNTQTNPTGPASGSYRVLRGGGWNISAGRCRVAVRDGSRPYGSGGFVGFRLCRAVL